MKLASSDVGKKSFFQGTQRTLQPVQTLERVKPYMPVMGITRIANVTGLDCTGIPVVMVARPNSRSISVFQGKGVTLEAAMASGLMEAVESYHAETITKPLTFASYEELRYTHRVLHPAALPKSPDSLFHPTQPLLWIESYDLLHESTVWVPYDAVHTDYRIPAPPGGNCCQVSTNGLASGNHPLEAISHAICEVVERDATTLWNYKTPTAKLDSEIDLGSLQDADANLLLEQCLANGFAVRLWDATSDIGIPVVVAELIEASEKRHKQWPRPAFGSGCNPCSTIALMRALTEAAQARNTFISGARDDISWGDYAQAESRSPIPYQDTEREAVAGSRNFNEITSWQSENLLEDVRWELDRLTAVGCGQVLLVELSKPAFGIPVVRAIIPGLEGPDTHYDEYVPGKRAQRVGSGA